MVRSIIISKNKKNAGAIENLSKIPSGLKVTFLAKV